MDVENRRHHTSKTLLMFISLLNRSVKSEMFLMIPLGANESIAVKVLCAMERIFTCVTLIVLFPCNVSTEFFKSD